MSWGLAYQVMDDLKDCLLSSTETGKSTSGDERLGRPNYANLAGIDAAMRMHRELLTTGRESLGSLMALEPTWEPLAKLQHLLDTESARLQSRMVRAA